MAHHSRAALFQRLLLVFIIALGLTACGKGPFSPEARRQSESLNQYMRTLKSALVTDDTFEWRTLSSALIIRALPYAPAVSQAASRRFADDPTFRKEADTWNRISRRNAGQPVIILMGVHTPDLGEKDITKLGRFRPRLKTADGRLLQPLEIKRYGRDSVFIRDHFPVFNPWEEVFLVKFSSPDRREPYAGPLEFALEWPGGVQTLILNN